MAYVRMAEDSDDGSLPGSKENLNSSEPDRFERISVPEENGPMTPQPAATVQPPNSSLTDDPILRTPPSRITVVRKKHLQKTLARKFSGAEGILLVIALIIFSANAAARGYLNGVLILIQHTMNIKDSEVIFTDIMFDIGIVIGIIPGVLIRGSMHRPKTLAVSTATLAVGCFMCAGPYFFYARNPHRFSEPEDVEIGEYELCQDPSMASASSSRPPPETAYSSEFFVIFGAGVMGVGAALMFVVGLPYTVDAFGGRRTPLVTGILLIAMAAGVWSGELFSFLTQVTITDDYSYNTVSKWWLGFLLFGLFMLLFSLYLCTLPDAPSQDLEQGPDTPPEEGNSPNGGETPGDDSDGFYYMRMEDNSQRSNRCLPFLSKHINIVFLSVALSLEGAILTGYLVFQPQFMSVAIGETLPRAEISFASVTLIPLIIGVLLSAFYIQFVRMDSKQLCRLILLLSAIGLGLAAGLFMFGCEEPKIYHTSPATQNTSTISSVSSELSCSESCDCSADLLTPICGSNEVTYLSPCLAGCQNDSIHHNQLTFHNCTCMRDREGQYEAWAGPCPAQCPSQGWHMLLIFTMFIVTGVQLCAAVYVILKASDGFQRVCALAFCEVVYRIIGNLPALGYFRFTLRHTCLYWASQTGRHDSFQYSYDECVLFDVNAHFRVFASLVVALKVLALLNYTAAFIRTKIEADTKTIADRESIHFTRIELDDEDSTENEPPETPV